MRRELHHLTFLLMLGFGTVALNTFAWTTLHAGGVTGREDNPRRVLADLNLQRGRVYDCHGELLAFSQARASRTEGLKRVYPIPATVSALGYYNYRYGAAGVEEGYDAFLRGVGLRPFSRRLWDELLNRPQQGGDLRLTLDSIWQMRLDSALTGYTGAALLVEVPSGAVWAMVSQPNFDPNQSEVLALLSRPAEDEIAPKLLPNFRLLNRVTDGRYQAGGVLAWLWLADWLEREPTALTQAAPSAPVRLAEPAITLACVHTPQAGDLSAAWQAGCPAPFRAYAAQSSLESVRAILARAGLAQTAQVQGFPPLTYRPTLPDASANLEAEILGQGALTLSPIYAIQWAAALWNGGRGVPLHLIAATRPPYADDWEAYTPPPSTLQPFSPRTAALLRAALGTADLVGTPASAQAGVRTQSWFVGGWRAPQGQQLALVIVLEGVDLPPDSAQKLAESLFHP